MELIAFRIKDFCSIIDTGECNLSGDNITVLAGQNEAGKTAILSALRDFDLSEEELPVTKDYIPDGRIIVNPSVSVKFKYVGSRINEILKEENLKIPGKVRLHFSHKGYIQITRDLQKGKFNLDKEVNEIWIAEIGDEALEIPEPENRETQQAQMVGPDQFASLIRGNCPSFVYFESFTDQLPREIELEKLIGENLHDAPRPIRDFIGLAEMDMNYITENADDHRRIGNYLRDCGTTITGDFLTYWKQHVNGVQKVNLRVRLFHD